VLTRVPGRFVVVAQELEKEIGVLRLMMHEKDVAIAEKEKRIYELKKKNQVSGTALCVRGPVPCVCARHCVLVACCEATDTCARPHFCRFRRHAACASVALPPADVAAMRHARL